MLPETRAHVEAARDGDPEAFGELVNRYRGPICGFVYSIVEDYHLRGGLGSHRMPRQS